MHLPPEMLSRRSPPARFNVLIMYENLELRGAELGTTEKTIKFHRGHIMHKMMAKSLADLVRMAGHLELPGQRS